MYHRKNNNIKLPNFNLKTLSRIKLLFFVEMLDLFINKRKKKFTIRKSMNIIKSHQLKERNRGLLIPSHPANHQATAIPRIPGTQIRDAIVYLLIYKPRELLGFTVSTRMFPAVPFPTLCITTWKESRRRHESTVDLRGDNNVVTVMLQSGLGLGRREPVSSV